jgi:hypothetical protein
LLASSYLHGVELLDGITFDELRSWSCEPHRTG